MRITRVACIEKALLGALGAVILAGASLLGGGEAEPEEVKKVPAMPRGLQVAVKDSNVTLKWNAVEGATLYQAFYGPSADQIDIDFPSATDPSVPERTAAVQSMDGDTWWFAVTACNDAGESRPATISWTRSEVLWDLLEDPRWPGTVTFLVNGKEATSALAGASVFLRILEPERYTLVENAVTYEYEGDNYGMDDLTFTMPLANVTVHPSFKAVPDGMYTARVWADKMENAQGTLKVTPTEPVTPGAIMTLVVEPKEGYVLSSLKCYDRVGAGEVIPKFLPNSERLFYMPDKDIWVVAEFLQETSTGTPSTWQVHTGVYREGVISAAPESGTAGQEVTVSVTPVDGWRLVEGSLVYTDATDKYQTAHVIDVINGSGTFTLPEGDVFVSAAFEPDPLYAFEVTVTPSDDGDLTVKTISGKSVKTAKAGERLLVTVVPDRDYQLKAGSPQYTYTLGGARSTASIKEENGTYAFVMPAADVVVSAEFEFLDMTNTQWVFYKSTEGDKTYLRTVENLALPDAAAPVEEGGLGIDHGARMPVFKGWTTKPRYQGEFKTAGESAKGAYTYYAVWSAATPQESEWIAAGETNESQRKAFVITQADKGTLKSIVELNQYGHYILMKDYTADSRVTAPVFAPDKSDDIYVDTAGDKEYVFYGAFDGNGHTVELYQRDWLSRYSTLGLFGMIGAGAVIRNLRLTGIILADDERTEDEVVELNMGAAAGVALGGATVMDVVSEVEMSARRLYAPRLAAGGIIGYAENFTALRCVYTGSIDDIDGGSMYESGWAGITGRSNWSGTVSNAVVLSSGITLTRDCVYHRVVGWMDQSPVLSGNYALDTLPAGGDKGHDSADGADGSASDTTNAAWWARALGSGWEAAWEAAEDGLPALARSTANTQVWVPVLRK